MKLRYTHSKYWPKETAYDMNCWELERDTGIDIVFGMGPTPEAAKQAYLAKLIELRDKLNAAIPVLEKCKPRLQKMSK